MPVRAALGGVQGRLLALPQPCGVCAFTLLAPPASPLCALAPAGGMAQNTVTVNGAEVASTLSQPTHINIHIHQESAVAQLVKAWSSLKEHFSRPRDCDPSKPRVHSGQLALGVAQMLLGLLSCILGGLLYTGPWAQLRATGCAFWAGAVSFAAGAGTVVHEKRGRRCTPGASFWAGGGAPRGRSPASVLSGGPSACPLQGWLSDLLTMAAVATALAAAVLCAIGFTWQSDDSLDSGCDLQGWGWREDQCRDYMQMLTVSRARPQGRGRAGRGFCSGFTFRGRRLTCSVTSRAHVVRRLDGAGRPGRLRHGWRWRGLQLGGSLPEPVWLLHVAWASQTWLTPGSAHLSGSCRPRRLPDLGHQGREVGPTSAEGVRSPCLKTAGDAVAPRAGAGGLLWWVGELDGAWLSWEVVRTAQALPDPSRFLLCVQNMFLGIRALLLVVCLLQGIVSLAALGVRLHSACGHSLLPPVSGQGGARDEEEAEKKLLAGNSVPPSPSKEKVPLVL
ncbi:Transmembrane protein 176B [Galemys pyrenaicus]|uniref:Transmembrane protein 176B n=1 Tax=Galemys pyrenaicus TaxID=202257 RepID=A0A8J5ZHW6_GALPY|nr:Transmembrane protein 176B [Galemys pyrenaicus]